MSNPLMNMMQQSMGMQPDNGGMMSQIRQFARLVGSRNPQQMVRNLMRQKGIQESELQETMNQAKQIAREMGLM